MPAAAAIAIPKPMVATRGLAHNLKLTELGPGGNDPTEMEEARARRQCLVHGERYIAVDHARVLDGDNAPRTPADSETQVDFPFSTDEKLREQYIAYFGDLRFGRLLEDMDVFAYRVVMQHITLPRPLTVVTGGFDRVHILRRLDPAKDMRMTGIVSWVGRSSIEVTIECSQKADGDEWALNLRATVLMVALDRETQRSVQVNPLQPVTERDRELYSHGAERQQRRKQDVASSLKSVPPTPEELAIVHALFSASAGGSPAGGEGVFMDDTRLESVVLMHPQKRNIHGKVFGGYVMRMGFDLAWSAACLHLRSDLPVAAVVDDIHFLKPVRVGSLVSYRAKVVYTPSGGQSLQVAVTAEQLDVHTGERTLTTVLTFTFGSPGGEPTVRPVVPRTYGEAMEYLEARRRFNRTQESMRALSGETGGESFEQHIAALSPRGEKGGPSPRGAAAPGRRGSGPVPPAGTGTSAA